MIKLSLTIFSIGIVNFLSAQYDPEILNWYNGNGPGMETEKAYKKLKKKKSETVVVAVIDSGIDIEHEDLQGKIWTNSKEIAKNGIDDDKNGYIDDVHGWNFLGNAKGENMNEANLEKTRILRMLAKKYDGVDASTISSSEKDEFALYEKVKAEVESELGMYSAYLAQMAALPELIKNAPSVVAKELGKTDYTLDELYEWKPTTPELNMYKQIAIGIMKGELSEEKIMEQIDQLEQMVNFNYNVDFIDREIIGDNPDDFNDKKYGNPDVEGPDALHGTHVGGIIGAVRGNGLGGDGVAENVRLMSLRAVPNGDEFDKDIALAIRYAVDNGAKVINMSFGKAYSPHQKEVYEAFQYADSKDVLLVHAAGNDGKDIDKEPNFPTSMYSFQTAKLPLFLTIGASTRMAKEELPATFSNYGVKGVDIFAPGHEIYNSVPQSSYKKLQGTSMAAPMVSGVAALLKSYFPKLSMKEITEVMLKSGKSFKGTQQLLPGSEEMVDFAKLSVTGNVVNVKNAIKMAKKLEKSK